MFVKRRLAALPLLLALAAAPALRTVARAQDDGAGQKDGGDDKPDAKSMEAEAPKGAEDKPGAKPVDGSDAPSDEDKGADQGKAADSGKPGARPADESDAPSDEDKGADQGKAADNGKPVEEKPEISIQVVSPEGAAKPVQPEVSVADAPQPKAPKKSWRPRRAGAAKMKEKKAPAKTFDSAKKDGVPPLAPPPPPPAVPSTPVEPWNP
jgi:hypothetical protein